MYFHAAEAPPCYARISDEAHPLCPADDVENGFSKDMLTKTGEGGQHTTRANVFAREGQWFWEGKIVSMTSKANKNNTGEPLISVQEKPKSSCDRGTVRLGFCRREQSMSQPIGQQAYSYAAMRTSNNKFGSVNFRQQFFYVNGKEYEDPKAGDVIGLMITLPSLEIHEQVVKGTYNPADHPELSFGPVPLKAVKKKPATGKKSMVKSKSAVAKGKEKASTDTPEPEHIRDAVRREVHDAYKITTPATLDILRDRNPFVIKNLVYFECPDYTPRADLIHAATKGRTPNPETGKPWEVVTDAHPLHELPWLRTLPGSKIEIWVNGEYLGIAYEHLLAFLPPASYIEKSAKASALYGDVDDGALGYYPSITHYGGGTVECKFDGPWWYGFDKEKYPHARAIGERYKEQIVEDFVSDIVDEICLEAKYGEDYMKQMVERSRPPVGVPAFTGHGLVPIAPKP
jgi:COMPASS component BRE2